MLVGTSEKVTVNESRNQANLSVLAWRRMFSELWESRELIHRLWYRDFIGQFKQSFLGIAWLVLPPLAVTLVFTFLRSAKIMNVPEQESALPYVLFVLVGSTVWQMFSSVTVQVTSCIAGAGGLVSKSYFPREALAISAFGKALVATIVQAGAIVLVFAAFGFLPHWEAVFIPLALIPLAALSLGLGMVFAPIHAVMRDTGQALSVLFRFGMFLAPTVYPTPSLSSIAEADSSVTLKALFWFHSLNPVSHFMTAIRDLIQYGSLTEPTLFGVVAGFSFLVLAVGWRFFDLCESLVVERI